jgi:LPXTG-motif cell wall-anchored protein
MVAGTAPQAPKPAAAAKPAAARRAAKPAAPAAAPAAMLPHTESSTPLLGLIGIMLLLIGAGIAVIRRF